MVIGSRYVNISFNISPVADNALAEEDDLEGSSEEDVSVEVVSPPRRPVTRSVSAKRTASEMEDIGDLLPSPPHPRKVQRIGKPGIFLDRYRLLVTNTTVGLSSTTPLFVHSPSPEPTDAVSISGTAGTSASSHLDKDYIQSENPWLEIITYF